MVNHIEFVLFLMTSHEKYFPKTKMILKICLMEHHFGSFIASLDVPVVDFGNKTNAWPAVFVDLCEVFHAF